MTNAIKSIVTVKWKFAITHIEIQRIGTFDVSEGVEVLIIFDEVAPFSSLAILSIYASNGSSNCSFHLSVSK